MQPRPLAQIALHLDPQTLRVLVAIDDYRSFAGAAAAVNLVPSAVSRRVQDLETSLGFELVKRSPRSVEFTVAGKLLLARARRILDEMHAAVSELELVGKGVRGVVKVAASMFALHANLPSDLASFKARYPGIEFDFETLPSREVAEALRRGEVDIGIIAASASTPLHGLRSKVYINDHVVLMVPSAHRLARLKQVSFQDFATEDLLQLPGGTDIQQLLDEQAKRCGMTLRRTYRVGSLDAAVSMTRAGLGLAIIPLSSWGSIGPFHGLCVVPINESWSTSQLLLAASDSLPSTSVGYRLFSELIP